MKKFLSTLLLTLVAVVATAQSYTFNGKKYDWKLTYSSYCEGNSSLMVTMGKNPIQKPMTIYVSKQGKVAIVTNSMKREFNIDFSVSYVSSTDDHNAVLQSKTRGFIDNFVDLKDQGAVAIMFTDSEKYGNEWYIRCSNTANQSQHNDIANWLRGKTR